MTTATPVINCRNVWKVFGNEPEKYLSNMPKDHSFEEIRKDGYIAGVRDVSIEVARGEMLVIMGLSGSGKSTVAFPLEMRGQDKITRRERALEVIKLVGLEGREDYFPRELSGGQQQRVGIARSLAIEPDIWFLDEPFSALDPLIRREMQDEFLRLQEMLGKTIVFITHDFDEALRLADRIAIMKDGAVEQCDTPDQIVLNPSTEYVRKFTEEIDKARVIRARVLVDATANGDGDAIDANASIQSLARLLVNDQRDMIPVRDGEAIIGAMKRQDGLDILLGES